MDTTRTKVIIINGVTGAGKDTFVNLATSYCEDNEIANIFNISSVEMIKDMLMNFGWDGEKTDEVRDIMAGIKKIWISAKNGPTMFLMNNIIQYHIAHTGEDNIIFCHVREPEEIKKLVDIITGMDAVGIDIITLYIERKSIYMNGIDINNVRDSDDPFIISRYPYDIIIDNNSDLPALDEVVHNFINDLYDEIV